jgi:DNA-binding transcriptional LysR family regulator
MSSLNAHQIRIFLVAAETLNFTHAAQLLDVTQPSISQHIQALEDHFDLPLFSRLGRAIELTDAGAALIPLAREFVYLSNHIEEMMASLKGGIFGHLVVGCSTPTGRYILPKLLAAFHHQYPQVKATCQVTSQSQALKMLGEGKVHLALANDPPLAQDIEYQKVTTEHIVLIVHPNHPWAMKKCVEVTDLITAHFILPEEGSDTHAAVREALAEKGLSIYQLNALISLGSLEAIALSVQEGLGVGFVPEIIVSRLVKNLVVPVDIQGLQIVRHVYIARNSRRLATGAQNAFWNLILNPEKKSLLSLESIHLAETTG